MIIRIAMPEPTSTDAAYNARSLPSYVAALQSAGATPVIIPLHERQDRVARLLAGTHGVLLPGSGFDVDPERYGESRIPACGPADAARSAVDELLLQDAFNLHKPIFAICYGVQALNVWLNGSLIQDLEAVLHTTVNHAPGRDVVNAHPIHIVAASRLSMAAGSSEDNCNSSHHQAIGRPGDNLRVTGVCPTDGVIEAVELDSPSHFVVGVQWHPERTYTASPLSRALFAAFVKAAETWQPRSAERSATPA
ncbi:gamma-glutamyl-gamma-aminobutyrate hydrolase family protein [Telmatobacter sp. DSM 110680]|uniref:Gamma-glutamyl-gamma-aminobutyrate hydrolase family protein n=1 Tax=Telmatobacter sp. DSM 110680 TaxID=3036704 RepID=A0AAU7DMU7_9BACT